MAGETLARSLQDQTLSNSVALEAPDAVAHLLDGFTVTVGEDASLPARLCAEHLTLLGARSHSALSGSAGTTRDPLLGGEVVLRPESGDAIDCAIRGQQPSRRAPRLPGTEALAQALSGLMAVHGRDQRIPRRLGLEVASVAAGIVATQGVLATLIARRRGHKVSGVETSVLQAALLFLYHHLAIATCEGGRVFPEPDPAPGPPFCTADGHWVELEMLNFGAWIAFWKDLGVERTALLEEAWSAFVYRYTTGRCALPSPLHEATRRHTLAALRRIAGACRVGLCRVRTYPELLAERGWSEGDAGLAPPPVAPWTICPGAGASTRSRNRSSSAEAPLSGLRVVESTSRLQGPLASHLLHRLGAEVIKIEPPGGDFTRFSPPLAGALGAAYLAYNRGKEVVEIDYKQPGGRAEIIDLVAGADVFLHNWRSGRAETLGFDFEDFSRVNPALVYAHASGWGRAGNEPSPIAGDFLVQAHAGCGEGLNPPDEPPFPSRLTIVDVVGGLVACEGMLAGLYFRAHTGRGCRVDTSLFAGAMTLQGHLLRAATTGQEVGRRLGRPLWGPLDRPIETIDGFLVVAAGDEQARKRLAAICGLGASVKEEDLEERIIERLRSRPAALWEELLCQTEIPAAEVCTDLAGLPHDARIAGYLETVNDACWAPAAPWQFRP